MGPHVRADGEVRVVAGGCAAVRGLFSAHVNVRAEEEGDGCCVPAASVAAGASGMRDSGNDGGEGGGCQWQFL